MNNKNVMKTILLLLILTLAIGCVSPNDQKTEPTIMPTTTEPTVVPTSIDETVVPTTTGGTAKPTVTIAQEVRTENFVAYTFKVNDEKVMLNRNIQLKELATEEGTALINIDGVPYRLTYSIEKEINDRIIKISDIDGINETVKITVWYKNI